MATEAEPGALQLEPFGFWLTVEAPISQARLQQAMAAHFAASGCPGAEPLRWAITAVDPHRGLQLEGVAVWSSAETGRPALQPEATGIWPKPAQR